MAIDTRLELMKSMRAVPEVLRTLVRVFETDALARRPEADEWAAVEVVAHLADTEERALERVRRILSESEPELAPFDPDALADERRYLELDAAGEAERFAGLRAEHIALLESLDDDGWRRVGIHGEHGRMSVELYEAHVAAEEVDHLAQMSRLLRL